MKNGQTPVQELDGRLLGTIDILIVEDDEPTANAIEKVLSRQGYQTGSASTLAQALTLARQFTPGLVVLDLTLPDGDGLKAMTTLKQSGVKEVIILSGTSSPEITRQCLQQGALDFIAKPAVAADIVSSVRRADSLIKLENLTLGSYPFTLKPGLGSIESEKSEAGKQLTESIKSVAQSPDTTCCLITGEAGVLKCDVAASIHHYRALDRHALMICCAWESDNIALNRFTSDSYAAKRALKPPGAGYLSEAQGGTLVLDDLTALSIDVQAMLADQLDASLLDCLLIGVLREDPLCAIRSGRLNERLYEMLSVTTIEVPKLQKRKADVPYFANQMVEELNAIFDTEKSISAAFMAELERHDWPGNLVEFRNLMLTAYWLTEPGEEIVEGFGQTQASTTTINSDIAPFVGLSFQQAERQLVEATLAHFDDNKRESAKALGISTKTLYNRLKHYSELVE